jgi:aminopeptidase YwaD
MKLTHTFILSLVLSTGVFAQSHNEFHQSLVNQVSASHLQTNLNSFVGFGEKELGSTGGENAFNWLKSLYQSWGYTLIEQQAVNAWGETGYNLIVTKTGTTYPNTFVIVDAHYDTINGPGANDNGSGTVILLEMARILKDIPTEYSIKFIHFTAEEWGLIGSEKYVNDIVVPQNLDIKLVFNIDQVGGVAGEVNNRITCERDQDYPNSNNAASQTVTTELSNLIELYSDLDTHIDRAYGSDYMPFQEKGYVITGLYEYNESPYPHSSQDTYANLDMDFLFQVAKGSVGALSYFAHAYADMGIQSQDLKIGKIRPNPADAFIQIELDNPEKSHVRMFDLSGKMIISQNFYGNKIQLNTTDVPNGTYVLNIAQNGKEFNEKVIIQHK